MSDKTIYLLVAATMIAVPGFSAQERVMRVQNHVRVGYDDNIYYNSTDEQGSGYITDIVNLSGKFNFSARTDALLYWQPEFKYRFDADPDMVSYQDLYGRLNHAISERAFLTLSDRFRYQDQEGQVDDNLDSRDENFIENNVMGALDLNAGKVSLVKLGAGYEFRTWDDDTYGKTYGNNYDRYTVDGSFMTELKQDVTQGMIGANYVNNEYDGSRGSYEAITGMVGVDQNFSPNLTGFGRVGYSFVNVESDISDSDSATPYLDAGLELNPTARTTLTGSVGYSIYRSENSYYNAQNQFSLDLGARHDLTGKISIAANLSYIMSDYNGSDFAPGYSVPDAEDDFVRASVRGSYQINRNNFLEAGYTFMDRSSDSSLLREYTRNVVDVGWRLRL